MDNIRVPSTKIKIFPCSGRAEINDLQAYLVTEQSICSAMQAGFGTNYIISCISDPNVQLNESHILKFIIQGYVVTVSQNNFPWNGKDVWAYIRLRKKTVTIQTTPIAKNEETWVLCNYDSQSEPPTEPLDAQYNSNLCFFGVVFTMGDGEYSPTSDANNKYFKFKLRTGNVWTTSIGGETGDRVYIPTPNDRTTWNNKGTVTSIGAGTGLVTSKPEGAAIQDSGSLSLTTTGVSTGTYQGITVDEYGRITGASNQNYITQADNLHQIIIDEIKNTSAAATPKINHYTTCASAADASTKEALAITNCTPVLNAGLTVIVKFSNANTFVPTSSTRLKLKVGSLTAKEIAYNGSNTNADIPNLLSGTVQFVYDGTYWNIVSPYVNTDTKVTQTWNTTNNTTYPLLLSGQLSTTTSTYTGDTLMNDKVKANPYSGAFYATSIYQNGNQVQNKLSVSSATANTTYYLVSHTSSNTSTAFSTLRASSNAYIYNGYIYSNNHKTLTWEDDFDTDYFAVVNGKIQTTAFATASSQAGF